MGKRLQVILDLFIRGIAFIGAVIVFIFIYPIIFLYQKWKGIK